MEEFFNAVHNGDGSEVMGMLKLYDHTVLDVADENGMTPLMYVRHPGIALLLTLGGHDVDTVDELGRTPLMHSVLSKCDGWTFYALIKSGADMTVKDHKGDSALKLAIRGSQSKTLLAAWIKTYFDGSQNVEDLDLSQVVPIILKYDKFKSRDSSMAGISKALTKLVVFNIPDVLQRVELYFGIVKETLSAAE